MLYLLVGIDTEGDNQWEVRAREHQTFTNIDALGTLHGLFQRHQIRPTYFVTYPVATTSSAAAILRQLRRGGDCEIGAHHHAWETPPCSIEDVRRHPYALNLPIDRFERQLASLTEALSTAVGERPTSYRSGRFGLSASHVSALERAGYRVESSVAPLFCEVHKGGPDFVGAPLTPYFLAYDDVRVPGASQVLEVPVSAALNRRVPRLVAHAYARAPWPYTTRRALRKLGLARMVWLRPSYSSLQDMKALAHRLKGDGVPVLNLLFHSSEAIVGGSPYNPTAAALERFLERLDRFLAFATGELRAVPVTFREFATRFCAAPVPSTPGASSRAP